MKIPSSTIIATVLFLFTHIAETIIGFLIMSNGLSLLTLFLNLITILVPLLFLAGVKALRETLKILAIITVVYGFLLLYLDFTEENAYGNFASWMWIFNSFEILVGIFLYYTLFKLKTSE
ncbi:MAG TPA: hypothetical protein PKY59_03445 [Pyrinomonadaceae bacterium]|nr:hypothetical protein [Pyrinomonadaceae bacterium]